MELSSELIEIGPEKRRNTFAECFAKAWTVCVLVPALLASVFTRNARRFKK
jgi:hypothetical protein